MPSFSSLLRDVEARRVLGNHEQREAVVAGVGVGLRDEHYESARTPLVMNVLEPLITYSSPSRTARVRMPATSEPAPAR